MLSLNKINKLMDYSLSDSDVLALINNQANLILYPQLHTYNNIDDILGPFGACILLYESKPNYGHWCAIFKVTNNELEFFNSYGDATPHEGLPDGTLKFIPEDFRKVSNQDHTYLAKLMVDSPYNLSYNQYKFQSEGPNIKTCGRHVATRLNLRHLSLDEYYRLIKKYCKELNLTSDQVVSYFTSSVDK